MNSAGARCWRRIARQPYALKRLRAAKAGLEMVRGYKVKREKG